jgi:hypothetical protein
VAVRLNYHNILPLQEFSIVAVMQRYLSGGWNICGQLALAILPYMILAGAFVAFLLVSTGASKNCPVPFASSRCCHSRLQLLHVIHRLLMGVADAFQLTYLHFFVACVRSMAEL